MTGDGRDPSTPCGPCAPRLGRWWRGRSHGGQPQRGGRYWRRWIVGILGYRAVITTPVPGPSPRAPIRAGGGRGGGRSVPRRAGKSGRSASTSPPSSGCTPALGEALAGRRGREWRRGHESPAGRRARSPRPRPLPGARRGADRAGSRHRARVTGRARPATGVDPGTPVLVRRDRPSMGLPRRPQADRRPRRARGRSDGLRCLDAGASTGGFTDVLLAAGPRRSSPSTSATAQLAWPLRTDERVRVHDRTNVRTLTPEAIGGPVDLVVADLSFISLRLVLPALDRLRRGTATCCRWSSRSSRSAASGSARAAWSAIRRCGPRRCSTSPAAAADLGLGLAGRGRQPAARPGRQRRVLPVAARATGDRGVDRRRDDAAAGPSRTGPQ